MTPIISTFVWPVLVLVLGYAAMWISRVLLNVNADIDKLPPPVKQFIVTVISAILALAASLLHIVLPSTIAGLDQPTVLSVLTAIAALIMHNSIKITAATAPPSAPGH